MFEVEREELQDLGPGGVYQFMTHKIQPWHWDLDLQGVIRRSVELLAENRILNSAKSSSQN